MFLSLTVERRKNLLRKELRRDLFYLFAGWAGKHGQAFDPNHASGGGQAHGGQQQQSQHQQQQQKSSYAGLTSEDTASSSLTGDFEFSALQVRWRRLTYLHSNGP